MVHGGGFKPEAGALYDLWRESLATGLDRDFAKSGGRTLLEGARIAPVYFGDLVNPLLEAAGQRTDSDLDLADRRRDLQRLATLSSKKKFRRASYESTPGKSALAEFVTDVAAPVLTALRLADPVLARKLPALAAYLSNAEDFRTACEDRLLGVLSPLLARGDDVLLLSHALGSVVCYDALWRLTHQADDPTPRARVGTWITFGSPLASEYVKQRLRGAGEAPERRLPDKVNNWLNVSAEDDFYCHDKTVADDFAALLRQRQVSQLKDYRIYNLAVRYGRSNPHNACGYLVHPRMVSADSGFDASSNSSR
jgi:hypothetical protein